MLNDNEILKIRYVDGTDGETIQMALCNTDICEATYIDLSQDEMEWDTLNAYDYIELIEENVKLMRDLFDVMVGTGPLDMRKTKDKNEQNT